MQTRRVFSSILMIMIMIGLPTTSIADAADDGEKIFVSACSTCHTAKKQPLDKTRLTTEGWNEAVARMISYGAEIPKGKLNSLLNYLNKTRLAAPATGETRK